MFLLGVEVGGETWQWRRRLWAWEEELVEECRELLLTITLHESSSNRWLWLPDQTGGYSVCGVYDMLTSQEHVPLKVSIFAWRLLRDHLPTKENLANRGIISMEAQLCSVGCGHVEDLNHLFLSCPSFGALGVEGVESQVISDHFFQFNLFITQVD